jgi:glycerophosphoryl diester phosphodiesterase
VVIQSFSPDSLKRLSAEYGVRVPLVQLVDTENAAIVTAKAMHEIRKYAQGIGPSKDLVRGNPDLVKWAHAAGLSVTVYTFRQSEKTQFKTAAEEMDYFMNTLGVDAVFTDNPDMFPG